MARKNEKTITEQEVQNDNEKKPSVKVKLTNGKEAYCFAVKLGNILRYEDGNLAVRVSFVHEGKTYYTNKVGQIAVVL